MYGLTMCKSRTWPLLVLNENFRRESGCECRIAKSNKKHNELIVF
jgi:hypothetical protein